MPHHWFIQFFVLFTIKCIAFAAYGPKLAGKFSHDVDSGHLFVPRRVHSNGTHLSYNVTHFHGYDNPNEIDSEQLDNKLHYHIDLHDQTLHVELEPSVDFIGPSMVVERHRRDTRSRTKYKHHNRRCHFQGQVRDDHTSSVALSSCNGISGMLRTKRGDYYIEPSKHHQVNDAGHHPHIIFQRSAIKQQNKQQQNSVDSDIKIKNSSNEENSIFNNKVHSLRKRRKRRKGHLKKHEASNCGTKEPKRPSETHIEWQPQGKVIVQNSRRIRHRIRKKFSNDFDRQRQRLRRRRQRLHHAKKMEQILNRKKNLTGEEADEAIDYHVQKRSKRSVSSPRHVEALVVADPSMVTFHQDGDVEMYLLTIMNMVSGLYKDPAIGNLIKVVVIRIVLLEEEEAHPDFNVTHAAEGNLRNFCRWQRLENPKDDSDPNHHDVAILITRKDICSVDGCTTLGVANVGGMCRPERSCSVNEDNGITLAHTITHELGHNFGMYHDTEKTGCDSRAGQIVHVMTPSFEVDTIQVSWSNCSRRYITHFLDQGLGNCLDDSPTEMEVYPDLPPGAMYNADLQCRLQFNTTDESVKVCSKMNEICSQLWCLVNDECVTQLRPAAPGTNCGKHKWCQNQECVPIEDQPPPIDGQWGNWTEYSECSRTCGGGVSIASRECDNPRPENGGAFCVGERIRYKVCKSDPCPENEPSFRAHQCSKFNNETYRDKKYEWQPYFDSHDPCELYCTDSDDTLIVPWGDSAADGTPCNIGTNDMCISGICRKVGCDWVVDSDTTEDQCGICGGNGETCTTIKGEFNKKMNVTDDYFEITKIPTGSRQILIEEIHPSKNYLSIGRANSNQTFLNGDRLILMPGEFSIDKMIKGLYERDNEQEKIKIPGPIPFEMAVKVLVRGKSKNPGVRYEYTLSANETKEPVYYWKLGDWSACSATCDGGIQQRQPICFESVKSEIVDEKFCWSSADNDMPNKKHRVCNDVPCPAHWWVGPWQLCSVTCRRHGQPPPVKRRTIMCVDFKENALSDSSCSNIEERPSETEICDINLPFCNGEEDNNENSNMI
ncbi:A disintegrin and metalloproteinase with thrombospondin motifs 7 [Sitodiplosis mosellana]|uniref:A disintegrin and metalloproteinase with thrombospondin motifs 7 n=1 Tax=Sitodiplosis mosellana TaxID=263140 RepID=UPI00244477FD|nr:A disintegrin and metalloproteinase with thrombospondin motifs 7 [Sitodiplosis mosellana]XP_055304533.1 A disintegrin and metalloproteinase with thrombospondin motifs 7 [Sitodiplosis mosellana]XP_055304542.1 A disintegrin and metalloproteinase with thrombospondin motifs 7 [Sitodiplosis mosellana]XP_055304550.1 A disintegrin and metalloproteinase with thrombospondin motifs 7 [Sitodiplosis mosellana]XP_055304559.1 A disintegrin and metalloproteinase with thrombospondin motifs 7 [Sitodiplosis m